MSTPLVGDDDEVKAHEEVLASLTSIATRIKPVRKPKKLRVRLPAGAIDDDDDPRLKSPFFFRTSRSLAEEVREQQKEFKHKAIKPVEDHLEGVTKRLKKTMPKALGTGIDEVRDYILNELAPKAMSAESGAEQAKQALAKLLNTEVHAQPFTQFEMMTRMAMRMRMAQFLVKHFNLPKGSEHALLEAVAPVRPQLIPIHPPTPETPQGATGQRKKRMASTTPMLTPPIKKKEKQ